MYFVCVCVYVFICIHKHCIHKHCGYVDLIFFVNTTSLPLPPFLIRLVGKPKIHYAITSFTKLQILSDNRNDSNYFPFCYFRFVIKLPKHDSAYPHTHGILLLWLEVARTYHTVIRRSMSQPNFGSQKHTDAVTIEKLAMISVSPISPMTSANFCARNATESDATSCEK